MSNYLRSSLLIISISDISNIVLDTINESMLRNKINFLSVEIIFDDVVKRHIKTIIDSNKTCVNIHNVKIQEYIDIDVGEIVYMETYDIIKPYIDKVMSPYKNYMTTSNRLRVFVTFNEIILSKMTTY